MLTKEEKKTLLDILNSVQISGNRQTIPQMMEKMDTLTRKIEAMPTTDAGTSVPTEETTPTSSPA
jgi:uncharacterized coiled-coil protein SlyX